MIRVLVADDEPHEHSAIKNNLIDEADIEIVGTARDGEEAIRLAEQLRPDIVLMDVRMPNTDGVTATHQIISKQPSRNAGRITQVVVLTKFNADEAVYRAIQAGASGFLLKQMIPGDLARALRTVAAGNAWIAPEVTPKILDWFASQHDSTHPLPEGIGRLTPREREVFNLLGEGLANAEIVQRLFISEGTLKTHIKHIRGKLDLHTRTQVALVAYRARLIHTDPDTDPSPPSGGNSKEVERRRRKTWIGSRRES